MISPPANAIFVIVPDRCWRVALEGVVRFEVNRILFICRFEVVKPVPDPEILHLLTLDRHFRRFCCGSRGYLSTARADADFVVVTFDVIRRPWYSIQNFVIPVPPRIFRHFPFVATVQVPFCASGARGTTRRKNLR